MKYTFFDSMNEPKLDLTYSTPISLLPAQFQFCNFFCFPFTSCVNNRRHTLQIFRYEVWRLNNQVIADWTNLLHHLRQWFHGTYHSKGTDCFENAVFFFFPFLATDLTFKQSWLNIRSTDPSYSNGVKKTNVTVNQQTSPGSCSLASITNSFNDYKFPLGAHEWMDHVFGWEPSLLHSFKAL